MNNSIVTTEAAIAAIRAGENVTAPYHVEGYGPGKSCHIWGQAQVGPDAVGPEGYLRLGVNDQGELVITEWDDWCPAAMQGRVTPVDGGRYISRDDDDDEDASAD